MIEYGLYGDIKYEIKFIAWIFENRKTENDSRAQNYFLKSEEVK